MKGAAFAARQVAPVTSRRNLVVKAATALPSEVRTVTPLGDRVLVKAVEPEQKTSSGILLPTSAQKRPTQGDIISASESVGVTTGDRVVYSKYAGTEVELQGAPHIILKEDDVIGLIGGDDISALRPLQDRVLLEVVEAADQTSGGLMLTEATKEKPTIGKVVAVGPGRKGEDGSVTAPAVSAGSTVLYSKYSGSEFEGAGGKQYVVVRDSDILASVA